MSAAPDHPPASPPDGPLIPEVRELATAWSARIDEIARGMFEVLVAELPIVGDDPEIAGLTLASCTSNAEAILSMLRHGIPVSATEAPVAALEHARRMAGRGGGVDATLRFYRLGHAYFWERWSLAMADAIPDRERLVLGLAQTAAFAFRYIDAVSARVGAEHVAERERRQRRAAIVRADVVRALLAGETVDRAAAERSLGHALRGPQLAFLCWSTGDAAEVERVAVAVAAAVGSGRPLLVPDGPHVLGGWVAPEADDDPGPGPGGSGRFDAAARSAIAGLATGDVHVAVGAAGEGLRGFRSSRRQAERARRVALLVDARPPTVTHYADVALVELLTGDVEAARAFVATELGGLAAPGAAEDRVRSAVLAVVSPQGGLASAARELGVHRNTILKRVRRAEELRGRPIAERPAELHAALLLVAALGSAVLRG